MQFQGSVSVYFLPKQTDRDREKKDFEFNNLLERRR